MQCDSCGGRMTISAKYCSGCGAPATSPQAMQLPPAVSDGLTKEKIATQAKEGVQKTVKAAKAGLKTELGKSMATGAALGALIALPIPFVGPVLGAAIGASIGAYRKLT